jgi:hypothetical protein
MKLNEQAELELFLSRPTAFLMNKINMMQSWGRANSPQVSLLRFLSSL